MAVVVVVVVVVVVAVVVVVVVVVVAVCCLCFTGLHCAGRRQPSPADFRPFRSQN